MASGGLLIYMSTRSPGSGGSSIMAGQQAGFTTADTDLSFLPLCNLSAGTALTYRYGCIDGDVTTSQSADLSQGKGFLAASIDGEFTVQDADGLIAADIANGHVNPIGWDMWVASIPAGGIWYDIIVLVQMKTVDLAIGEGVIRFIEKSPAYLGNHPMYGVRTLATLSTDPIDPNNPTDPTYAVAGVASQFAGVAFGSLGVSIKADATIPVNKLAYFKQTTLATGSIATSGAGANLVATSATDTFNSNMGLSAPDNHLPYKNYGNESLLVFMCKDLTETARLYDEIKNFAQNGYSIVLSDGQWFIDISALDTVANLFGTFIPGTTFQLNTRISAFEHASIGPGYPYGTGVVFTLDYPATNVFASGYIDTYYPPAGLDPASCSIYAVPSSIAVSAQQSMILGFARNGNTVPPAGSQQLQNGVTVFAPNCVSSDGIVSISPVQTKLLFDPNQSGNYLGGIVEGNDNHSVALAGSGDIANISMDPSSPWSGGAAPVTFSGTVSGAALDPGINVRLSITPSLAIADGDIFCVESTWKATFTAHSGGMTRDVVVTAGGPFKKMPSPLTGITVTFSGGMVYTMQSTASKSPSNPNWQAAYNTLADMANSPTPIAAADGALPKIHSVSMDVMECFIFAYSKLGFDSIYATIYPFWTRKNCTALATDGAGTILAGGAGLGVASADGSIAWTPFDVLPNANGVATIRSAAYGASTWVMVGYRLDGSTFTNCFWHSADGVTWTEDTFAASTGLAECVRYVGGYFVCLYGINGTWKHSADGITWTDHASIVSGDLNDVAYDGTKWHFAGGNGFVAWTASITSPSFTSYGAGTSAGNCVNVISGFGPTIDCIVVGNPAGVVSRCPLSSLSSGSWASYTLGGSSWITDIGKSGLGLMAVSTQGAWFSIDGANWTATQFDHLDFNAEPAITNTTVGGSTNLWIIGADAQIATLGRNGSWIPWGTRTPSEGLANIAGRYFGGLDLLVYGGNLPSVNPVRWTEPAFVRSSQSWGIAFDPPTDSTNSGSGTNADAAARKIAEEWWAFAGEMPAATLDGSNDAIEEEFPEIALGNIEDVATIITVQYAPFGGNYLKSAYIQNVDVDRATAGKPDVFFFNGWDATGNYYGLALWTACRNAYLKTQILRATALTFDSAHDETTLGMMWATTDADLGQRIAWLCSRPRYLKMTVVGNDSQAALAQCGCRYKPNTAMLAARGMPALNSTGYGVVVQADHNYTQGTHVLDIAFPPTQQALPPVPRER